MTRKTKSLSGASQDAYFRRVLKTYPNIGEEARERIVRQLRREVSQLRVRLGEAPARAAAEAEAAPEAARPEIAEAVPLAAEPPATAPVPTPAAAPEAKPFDPFSVNVIVVLRKSGRAAALAALAEIGDADNLRLLAREQRLSVDAQLSTPADLSTAIVAAAERRVANRRAAASAG